MRVRVIAEGRVVWKQKTLAKLCIYNRIRLGVSSKTRKKPNPISCTRRVLSTQSSTMSTHFVLAPGQFLPLELVLPPSPSIRTSTRSNSLGFRTLNKFFQNYDFISLVGLYRVTQVFTIVSF